LSVTYNEIKAIRLTMLRAAGDLLATLEDGLVDNLNQLLSDTMKTNLL